MSAHRVWEIWCDGKSGNSLCHERAATDEETAAAARTHAAGLGWVSRTDGTRKSDLCPSCAGVEREDTSQEGNRS